MGAFQTISSQESAPLRVGKSGWLLMLFWKGAAVTRGLRIAPIWTALFIATFSPALAVSINEFDSATKEQQIEYLTVQSVLLKKYYVAQGMQHKADCMEVKLKKDDGGDVGLITLILDEIDLARRRGENHPVEDIIFGVVEHECSKPN